MSLFCAGGWKPEWDKQTSFYLLKSYKGTRRERTRVDRAAKITAALKGMPDKIAKYEQDIKDKKPKKDILYKFKRYGTAPDLRRGK